MNRCITIGFCLLGQLGLLLALAAPALAKDEWRPIDTAALASSTPAVEKDAEAEALFDDVRVEDREEGGDIKSILTHYVRIKIYSEKGKESQSKVELVYFNGTRIDNIAGRTIKPDGSIVELAQNAIFDREIVKLGRAKLKAKTFAMPAVEPGAIIEYRWKESRPLSGYTRLPFQRDIPSRSVVYHIKPFSNPYFPYGMRTQMFRGKTTPFVKEDGGFYMTSMTNVPAFHEEPDMPPDDTVKPWMLVYYSEDNKLEADKFWLDYGKKLFGNSKSLVKVNDDIRKAVPGIIGDASTPEQKVERIFAFCRAKIKNMSDDASGLTDDDRAKWKENKQPSDTLKRGQGSGTDINLLFAALCDAAGLDARFAALSDRNDFFFEKSFPDSYFLNSIDIAIKMGDAWRFYDPASMYVPYGMLAWNEEGTEALVSDPSTPVWVETPISAPEKSRIKRTATLTMSDDGTVEGDVAIEYTGHPASERKEFNDDDSVTRREESVRDELKERLSTAEVSNIVVSNANDPDKPFTVSFHVRVPGYGQRTGKRLFFQPSFFQYNAPARFSAATREHLVYLHYPWSEEDEVSFNLPAGFALDNADSPDPFAVGKVGAYKVKIAASSDSRFLKYERSFWFGGEGSLYFPASNYNAVKTVFDAIHTQDAHTITLKQAVAN